MGKGFVIVSKEHGVYLGGNRWGGDGQKEHVSSHKDVKNVPVFAEEDPGVIDTLSKVNGKKVEDAEFQAVETDKDDPAGFVARKKLDVQKEHVSGEMGEGAGEDQPHGRGRHRRKKTEDEPQTETGGGEG